MFDDEDKKRKKTSDEFEKILREMEKIVGDAFKTTFEEVKGFSIRTYPDDKPYNINIPEDELPIDVMESNKSISVTIEIPGIKKEDIDLEITENTLEIHIEALRYTYHKKLELPSDVKPDTTKATYKNGVLDVEIQKRNIGKKGHKVSVK
ncbi:MAG: Hsp20/alpha crystallin family protein [Candidatus Thermoplasmatota archaeon]|nr:Hsp20/alpha crystallin family protein [Candidatus Thermoplasmatota archaeon]